MTDGAGASNDASDEEEAADGGFTDWASNEARQRQRDRQERVANQVSENTEAQNAVAALNGNSERGRETQTGARSTLAQPDEDEEERE